MNKFAHGLSIRGELEVAPLKDSNCLVLSKYERRWNLLRIKDSRAPVMG